MNGEAPAGALGALARLTQARVGLARAGASMPTQEVLAFGLAHARARDAVHEAFRPGDVGPALRALGLDTIEVESLARDRAAYLRRPDLGRRLSPESAMRLAAAAGAGECDLAIVVGDGLSAAAAHAHAAPLLALLAPKLRMMKLAPVAVASQARVALGDEAGRLLRARAVLVLIGERPGLSSPNSLGAYLTFAPGPGVTDANRNCVSNIRPGGLGFVEAARILDWLIGAALSRGVTGVALKDESGALLEGDAPPASLTLPASPA